MSKLVNLHIKILRLLIFSLCLSLGDFARAEQKIDCLPGQLVQWELDHCFLRSGTDDEHHQLVRACMDLAPPETGLTALQICKRKNLLKKYRCLLLQENTEFRMSLEMCMSDPDTAGQIVKNFGIGG